MTIGADPVNFVWNVVRGDTASILIEFYQEDGETLYDTSEWDFEATAFNYRNQTFDQLDVNPASGSVEIVAQSFVTENWGAGIRQRVAELNFDLQVTTGDGVVWTPVIGTISVTGDITGGRL